MLCEGKRTETLEQYIVTSLSWTWCRACLFLLHRCHQVKNLTTFKSKRGMGIHSWMCGATIDGESLLFDHFFVSRKHGHWNSKVSFSAI